MEEKVHKSRGFRHEYALCDGENANMHAKMNKIVGICDEM